MSRNTSVSRNGAGSAAIAARSCSASILARSVVSGVSRIRIAWIGLRKLDRFKIVDGNDRSRTVLAQPGISGVAHDAQQPGAGTAAGVSSDGAEGAQRRILHHVFGISAIARQPTRQPIGVVDMRHHNVREARIVVEAT